jgi:HlyD family secretion protein
MKKFKILIIVSLVLIAGTGIWFFFFRKKDHKSFIVTEKPQFGYISRSVTATGTIEPVDTVTVGSQVSGTISGIFTDFNARVVKGQLIAKMDQSLFNAQVDQYKANLQLALATMTFEKSNFDRQSLLFNTGSISRADYEAAQDQFLTSKASMASVQAQLNAALKNLSYSNIYSPVNGVVLTRNISVGQTVAASFNTPTLFIIAKDITKMQVQAAVDEADIGEVKDSQRVIFTVDAYPDISFSGKVNQIRLQPVVSANVVTYTTIVTAPNDDLKLKPGMTANIFIYTKEVNNALLIPSKALKFKPDPSLAGQYKILATTDTAGLKQHAKDGAITPAFVWLQSGDSLQERKILTGLNDDTHVEVLDGLTVSDSVITGVSQTINNPAAATGSKTRSPFMPTRQATPSRHPASTKP